MPTEFDTLDNEALWQILEYWSYWELPPRVGVMRQIPLPQPDPQLALAIQGVRRCGKSTLLGQMIDRFRLDRVNCLFANFEDPRLTAHLTSELLFRIVNLFSERRQTDQPLWFFFDEIQNVRGWESWLHTALERNEKECFVVTGSNASLLSGELSTKLAGRHRLVELYPFDYTEATLAVPETTPENFLAHGGFPKIVLSGGDLALRQQYFRDIVERDITNRAGARSSQSVVAVIQMAFESCGSELSLRRLAAVCGLSADTVGAYLRAAEDAYLLFSCPFFSHSSRQRRVRNQKYYPIDTGLRRAVVAGTSPDLGKSLECSVYLALKKRFSEVCYWRQQRKVDFVVVDQGRPLPVLVSWGEPQDRHHLALDEFYSTFPNSHEACFVSAEDLADGFATCFPA
ncbi:MAG: ATP-binding protein [Vulcanimicrobiota bacterium]